MLFIQFWMFSKDFSSVMSYTRMMPWHRVQREAQRLDLRSQWKVQSEQKGLMTSAWLSSLFVLQACSAHHGSSVVGRGNSLEPLLSCCVPAQCTHVQVRKKMCCFVSSENWTFEVKSKVELKMCGKSCWMRTFCKVSWSEGLEWTLGHVKVPNKHDDGSIKPKNQCHVMEQLLALTTLAVSLSSHPLQWFSL